MGSDLGAGLAPHPNRAALHLVCHCHVDLKITIRSLKAKQESERSISWLSSLAASAAQRPSIRHHFCWTSRKIASTEGRMASPFNRSSPVPEAEPMFWGTDPVPPGHGQEEGHGQPLSEANRRVKCK